MNNQNDKPTGEYCSLYPPAVNPEYYINSGIFDHLKASGITIRYTHSLEEMKRQHETGWNEYLKHYKEQAEKYGNHVEEADIQLARKQYVENEVNVFTGLLAGSLVINDSIKIEKQILAGPFGENDKIEIQKHLIDLKKELDWLADGKQKAGIKSFSWTGSQAQLEALWQALKDAGYIDTETTKEVFTGIFADELINCKAVQWTGSNRLLSYLFNQMNSGNKPLILSQEWQSIIEKNQLFINRNGKPLKAGDLSTALNSISDRFKGCNPCKIR